MQYGYEGESYTVTPEQAGFDLNNYFDLVKESASFSLNSLKFQEKIIIKLLLILLIEIYIYYF